MNDATLDRYVSFQGIDCDGNADRLMGMLARHMATTESRWVGYFDKKLAEEEAWIRRGILARRTRNEGRVRALEQLREIRRQRRDRTGRVHIAGEAPETRTTILVVDDPRFALHLHHICHLESPKRFEAFQRALAHPSVAGRWHALMIEPAEREQLLWVHNAAYLKRLEKTAGRQLVSLDMDTQTTERSWEVACLAVGGVFRLMDGICDGRALQGVAAVRPPGQDRKSVV